MKCMYCGTPLSSIDYCSNCGADVMILKRIERISNLLYNEGLEKASVRDLSGAISCLKRSLKFNKENIDARNLLGLVYYETGEVVAALSEWVISKNICADNNAADIYISKLQSNKTKLDVINQTIRKYNQALEYCRQNDEDMAVIQLKRVLAQNSNLIKGYHLLALIYMKQQEYEKARKLLKKAAQIDTTNTTTLRYLHEVEEATGIGTNLGHRKYKRQVTPVEKEKKILGPTAYMSGNDTIIQPTPFRDSSSVATFINIFLGFLLGAAVIWFLAIPANTRKINQSANQQVTDANTKLAAESARVDSLEAEIEEYQAKVDEANQTMDAANDKADGYDVLLSAAAKFLAGDQTGAGTELAEVKADSLEGNAKTLYDTIMATVKSTIYATQYSEGANAYAAGDYDKAIEMLKKATETDDTQYDAWYYLCFAYYNKGDTENADKTLAETIKKFPAYEATLSPYITDPSVLTQTDGTTAETNADNTSDTQETNADGTLMTQDALADANQYADSNQYTDPNQYTDQNQYTDPNQYTDGTQYTW